MANHSLSVASVLALSLVVAACGKPEPAAPAVTVTTSTPQATTAMTGAAPAPMPSSAANPSAAPAAGSSPTPVAVAVTAAAAAPPAAATPKDLAAKSGCLACHAADKKLVGPSYQDVAKKYSAADEAKLVAKVKAGGAGVWGGIAMPPNSHVKDDDLHAIVRWILSGAH